MSAERWGSLVAAARRRAEASSGKVLFTALEPGGPQGSLTAADLDRRSRGLASTLQEQFPRGARVVLLLPPGLDYVVAYWACLYAGVIPVPAYPPDPGQLDRTLPRLGSILRDCAAAALLTTEAIRELAGPIFRERLEIADVRWVATEEAGDPERWKEPGLRREDLAFLQYTSGSTREPAGVMLSHGNILDNMAMVTSRFELDRGEISGVFWLPPYHDMGLFGSVVLPVLAGFSVFLMSPLDFLRDPLWWLRIVSEHRLMGTGGPNFAYDLCVRKSTPEVKASLDLSSWTIAFSGAEPVRAATLARFAAEFAPCGFKPNAFLPCYGLAEATVMVSASARGAPPVVRRFDERALGQRSVAPAPDGQGVELVGAGHAADGLDVRIVDPESLEPCPPGKVGEIWASGTNVAQGYWGKKEETEATFGAALKGVDGRRYLRTGDLGFVHDGHLFVAGRIKDLIIVAGVNHYPQDVESVVSGAHPFVRPGCGAAFEIERGGTAALAVVTEAKEAPKEALAEAALAVREAVGASQAIAPALVVFIPKGALPKTSSGKVRRRATRQALQDGSLPLLASFEWPAGHAAHAGGAAERAAAGSRREELSKLDRAARRAAVTQAVLEAIQGPASGAAAPDPDAPLATLGIDSVQIVELLAQLEDDLGVVLQMNELVQRATLRGLIDAIDAELDRPPRQAPPRAGA